jgi:hypothetical protein
MSFVVEGKINILFYSILKIPAPVFSPTGFEAATGQWHPRSKGLRPEIL